MSLQFILGRSGGGKTHHLTHHILEEAKKNPETKYLIIVPEQYSVQMKKDMVAISEGKGILNIDVLSFLRLAYRVFEEKAGYERTVLDEVGKSMMLRKVLLNKKRELTFFQGNCEKTGFVGEVKSLLSEFVQYNVGERDLDEMIRMSEGKPMLKGKLSDVQIIYHEFLRYLQDEYFTAEEIFAMLVKEVGESETVRDGVVCIDGFMGFTPSQYELLGELMKVCKNVYITVTMDPNEEASREGERHELFYNSRKHIRTCMGIAVQNRVEILKHHVVGRGKEKAPYRFLANPALQTLERNLFRYPLKPYRGQAEGLQIHSLQNPEAEIRFVVKETTRLIREGRYRYRDFAVVTGDIMNYGRMAIWEMGKAGVPCFVDYKREIVSNSFVEAVLSVVEMQRKDFDYESVFRFLRCGYTDFHVNDVDRLENYVLANGVRGFHRYAKEWKPKDASEDGNEEGLKRLNECRETFCQWFLPLHEVFSGGKRTIQEYTKALYAFLERELSCFNRIEDRRIELEAKGEVFLAKEYEQIHTITVELLERLVDLLGEEAVTVKEYEELLKTGFQEAKVGLIPPGIDQVILGDVERSRLKDVKVLFFVGMNDGVVPKKTSGGGLLSDAEREYLLENGRELAASERERMFLQQFYLYLNLTKPSDRLYITYSKLDMDGKGVRASQVMDKVRALFPDAPIHESEEGDPLDADMGLRYLAKGLRRYPYEEMESDWKEVYRYHFIHNGKDGKLERMIKNAFYERNRTGISKEAADALYGGCLTGSVSRMERYAACAYAYFLTYGIRLLERREYSLGMADLGEQFHRVMERFSKIVRYNGASWRDITKEQLDEWSEEALQSVKKEQEGGVFQDTMRNAYIMNRIRRIGKWTLYAMCEQAKRGRFEEEGFELSFDEAELGEEESFVSNGECSMRLKGRIDRLDVCEDEEAIYVKVTDYKTGNTVINPSDLYYGLQIQLVVYLEQAMRRVSRNRKTDHTVVPAGMFYYQIKNPLIERPKEDGDDARERGLLMEMVPNGFLNRETRVLSLMDGGAFTEGGEAAPNYQSFAIPLKTTKDGSLQMGENLLDEEGFHRMVEFVRNRLGEYGSEITKGRIDVNPYQKKDRTACDFCPYKGVCGFDVRLPDNQYRKLKRIDLHTLLEEWGRLHKNEMDG